MMIIFAVLLIASFIRNKETLFSKKRNMAVFVMLSAIGIALGIVDMIRPYIPSIAYAIEKYFK